MKTSAFIIAVVVSMAVAATCPDGTQCNGQCCKKFIAGTTYGCCRGFSQCRQFLSAAGFCFLFTEPQIASVKAIEGLGEQTSPESLESEESYENSKSNAHEILAPESKMAVADAMLGDLMEQKVATNTGKFWRH